VNPYQTPSGDSNGASQESDEIAKPKSSVTVFFETSKLFLLISAFFCFVAIGSGASDRSMIRADLLAKHVRSAGYTNEYLLALINTIVITVLHGLAATIPYRFVPLESNWFWVFMAPLCLSCVLSAILL
jgi:hypothetical protein